MIRIGTAPPAPDAANHHRFRSAVGEHLLVVRHSRVFDLPEKLGDSSVLDALATSLGADAVGEAPLEAIVRPTPQAISLNVSSACNLACTYCYADRGAFAGKQDEAMTIARARDAIDRLFASADPRAPITVGFLGGEPFVGRALIHDAVAWASTHAAARGLDVRFSVTTNGTLLDDADVALLRAHPFAVTISIDGARATQDRQRPLAGGKGSFLRVVNGTSALLASPGKARVQARATVRARTTSLEDDFAALLALGFREVGFSPLRASTQDADVIRGTGWRTYLDALVAVARAEIERAKKGHAVRLANLAIALEQIERGVASPYPCGAGGGYFSVAASGDWYACHRAIGDDAFAMDRDGALDDARRDAFLAARHVHAQTDCRTCWARYLCSGGCHQEASTREPASCDFVRDWLTFCLGAYCELDAARPDFFAPMRGETAR